MAKATLSVLKLNWIPEDTFRVILGLSSSQACACVLSVYPPGPDLESYPRMCFV